MEYETIRVEKKDGITTVTLNRPEVHNAFNERVVEELEHCFREEGESDSRAVILTGTGKSFCAGADLGWMKSMATYSHEENIEDSREMSNMFEAIYHCPKPVIGRINGSAFGGGVGLVAVCDYVISDPGAIFSFSEVKLGIAPAVISPYVLQKVPPGKARYLFISGERFGPEAAHTLGLVDDVAPLEDMGEVIDKKLRILHSSGPMAVRRNKELVHRITGMPYEEAREYTIRLIAELRTSPEGQEGIGAFLEKRKPEWSVK